MYESFFQFSRRPFASAPSADVFFPAAAIENARLNLVRCIERSEGPGTLIGPAGTGKTLLLQVVARHFASRFRVALLSSARLSTRRALLQNILFELRLPYRQMDEGELRLSLVDHLGPRDLEPSTEGLLLLVDEAHTLPLRLLEEIRLITNLVCDGQPRVRLVLAGTTQLEERLASPRLESFHQRIAARCYLQSLGRDETIGYVQQQIAQAGGVAEGIFTTEALRAIHTVSDGVPRLINQVSDHALLLAALGEHRQMGPDGVAEAWADLQQLPAPWHDSSRPAAQVASVADENVIEFGSLEEEGSSIEIDTLSPAIDAAASAELRFGEIDRGLASLRGGERHGGDFAPVGEEQTEVELVFQSASDPFGSWEQEEVVIDRYAALEAESPFRRPRVSSHDGRQIGQALDALPRESVRRQQPAASAPHEDRRSIAATTFDPASDPVFCEPEASRVPCRNQANEADDDRDIIVIEGGGHARTNPPSGRVRRQEYRQLFSNLRKR